MKRFLFMMMALLFCGTVANAQRTWFEFEISKSLTKKLEIALAPEIRFKEGFEMQEYFFEPKIEYSFNKYFSLGANYRFGNNPNKDGDAQWFGRYGFDAKTGYDWKKLEAEFRLRYTNYDDFEDEDNDPVQNMRFKFKFDYDIDKMDLKPYFAYELYRNLAENEFTKARWETGLQYKINKHHRVGAYFRLNDYLQSDTESVKIIGLSYKFKF